MSRHHDQSAREPSQRQLRVGEAIRHALADAFRRGHLRDPELEDANLTVTEVRISPDLKNATAFVMLLGRGADDMAPVIKALNKASGFLRQEISGAVRLKFLPRLGFRADPSLDNATRIGELLNDPKVRRDLDAGAADLDGDD